MLAAVAAAASAGKVSVHGAVPGGGSCGGLAPLVIPSGAVAGSSAMPTTLGAVTILTAVVGTVVLVIVTSWSLVMLVSSGTSSAGGGGVVAVFPVTSGVTAGHAVWSVAD